MSHLPLRSEKNCLNCGTIVIERFCHHCGQENVMTKESFGSLLKHFIFDLLHFDGNFFPTVKYLFTRPGYIPKQYIEGKRMSYLHPVRMYLFTSALFFLVFFGLQNQNFIDSGKTRVGAIDKTERLTMAKEYEQALKDNPKDTSLKKYISLLKDTSKNVKYTDLAKIPTDMYNG
ncbi:MAG TPA: DUF3667 domain-containing protein, partial [Flavisolibacter sp.]|nr:DUF3667 domain-containing protein [Flavisolibacter sp.]